MTQKPDDCKRRDVLAQDYVMEMLRKSRPQSMDMVTCVKFAQAAYRLADAMLITGRITPTVEVISTVEHPKTMPMPTVKPTAEKRFITHEPRTVYNDGLWVNVNLDLPGEFSMPSFVEPGDTIKIIRTEGEGQHIFKVGDEQVCWSNVESFRKLG